MEQSSVKRSTKRVDMAVFAVIALLQLILPVSSGTSCIAENKRNVCKEGTHNPFCAHNISRHCRDNDIPDACYDTLQQEMDSDTCDIKRLRQDGDKGCGSLKPSHITPPEESLVGLRLYHHKRHWGQEGIVNMTFPAPTWEVLKLQYHILGTQRQVDACRQFQLYTPMNSTLMYDCPIVNKYGHKPMNVKLTVESDKGEGALYLFRVPPGSMINPRETCPSDWHVFFYIHQNPVQQHERLPVTVQSSPFGRATYRVVLARCHNETDNTCQDYVELDHEMTTKDTIDDLWTVYLPGVTQAGTYTVRLQIVADWCHEPGCHTSVSPVFVIEARSMLVFKVLIIALLLLILLIAATVILLHHRREVNKKIIKGLKDQHPTVLLAYHPESQAVLNFVNTLADFLTNTCCVRQLMADREVVLQDPTQWMKTKMTKADRILFIIPKDPEVQSVTIIRNLWKVALNHCGSHDFITNQNNNKVAKLLLPTSGTVPWEIKDVRHFELGHNLSALATWLHGGSWLDQILTWQPHIRSSATKKITPTWQDVTLAADKIESTTVSNGSELMQVMALPDADSSVADTVTTDNTSLGARKDTDDDHHSDNQNDNETAVIASAFDPEIPDFDHIFEPQEGGRRLSRSDESLLQDSEDEDIYI